MRLSEVFGQLVNFDFFVISHGKFRCFRQPLNGSHRCWHFVRLDGIKIVVKRLGFTLELQVMLRLEDDQAALTIASRQ